MENKKVLILVARRDQDGKIVKEGYLSTYGRVCEWFLKNKNPRERGFTAIRVYCNTEQGHEFYAWSLAHGVSHYSFDFSLDYEEFFLDWVK